YGHGRGGEGARPCDRARARRRARRIGALRGHSRRRRDVRVYVSTGGPGRVTTILLVEDDPALRRALRTMMRSRDLDVLDVATGEDAVVLASSGTPDLLVVDLGLPVIYRFGALRPVRSISSVPLLLLTPRHH